MATREKLAAQARTAEKPASKPHNSKKPGTLNLATREKLAAQALVTEQAAERLAESVGPVPGYPNLIPGRKPGAVSPKTKEQRLVRERAAELLVEKMAGLGAKALETVRLAMTEPGAADAVQIKAAGLVLDRLIPRLSQKQIDIDIQQDVTFVLDMTSHTPAEAIEISDAEYERLLAKAQKCRR